MNANVDVKTVEDFGREWSAFDQSAMDPAELERHFRQYFAVFPWQELPADAVGFDAGCGSGRWAQLVAPRVGALHCVDASRDALEVARAKLAAHPNCVFHNASVEEMPFEDGSMDFGYSLGVLHHMPDTMAGIAACVRKLKPGAPFLVYLYYALDGRPGWFRAIWRGAEAVRRIVSRLPFRAKVAVSTVIAVCIYWPLARLALLAERLGRDVDVMPLSTYRDRSLYSMRTDALDRFGTRLEQRFTKAEIAAMLEAAGCERIVVSAEAPYWCVVGRRAQLG